MDKISRVQARAQGKTRYFTGKPCSNGHVAERHTVSSVCVDCKQMWKVAYKEKIKKNVSEKAKKLKELSELLQKERAAAKMRGEKVFNLGIPCRKGHLSNRYVASGKCVACKTKAKDRMVEKEYSNAPEFVPTLPPGSPPIVTLAEAKAACKNRFFPGIACKFGHFSERYVSGGRCIECMSKDGRLRIPKNGSIGGASQTNNRTESVTQKRKRLKFLEDIEKKVDDVSRPIRLSKGLKFQEFLLSCWRSR